MSRVLEAPVVAVLAVGFHHKKGCQVEYCYPALVPDCPTELPPAWRHLPALALPDGSHNYLSDTIFFHLPGLENPAHTVYAVSCFRQIPIERVTQKTSDMTRSSVQKSVCVVCRAPVYGRLAVKLELVTRAWFLQGDFSNTKLLEDAYAHLHSCPLLIEQSLEGLCVRSLTEAWRHKALLLLKLLLLQRRVMLHGAPAGQMSVFLLSLLSLLPECVQRGLGHSADVMLSRPLSPPPTLTPTINGISEEDCAKENSTDTPEDLSDHLKHDLLSKKEGVNVSLDEKDKLSRQSFDETMLAEPKEEITGREKCHSVGEKYRTPKQDQTSSPLTRDMSVDGLNNLIGQVDLADCRLPLEIFVEGYLCLPYLSLQYLDLLSDPLVKGFVVGASNVLFKQKRQLFDVLVETNEMRIETSDLALKRQLQLTTEDLRFADHVVRHGQTQGDAWIREQFTTYLLYLLRTSLLPEGSREIEPYNSAFMSAFKTTPAYERWLTATEGGDVEAFAGIAPGHPFGGQLSVADMKLRLAHTMSSTEGGRKVTAAVASTGRAVAASSRAVGGALSQAKGAFSSWWSNFTAPVPLTDADQAEEAQGIEEKLNAVTHDGELTIEMHVDSVQIQGHQVETRSHQMVISGHQVETRSHQMEGRGHQMETHSHQLETHVHQVETHGPQVETHGLQVEKDCHQVETHGHQVETKVRQEVNCSDAEDAMEVDNKTKDRPVSPDIPDKTLEGMCNNVGKIQVV